MTLSPAHVLPTDGTAGTLAGRVWRPDRPGSGSGPVVVAVRDDGVFDVSATFPTMADLTEPANPAAALRGACGESLGPLASILANTDPTTRDVSRDPADLLAADSHIRIPSL